MPTVSVADSPTSFDHDDPRRSGEGGWPDVGVPQLRWRWGGVIDVAGLAGVGVAGLILRFFQRSPLWLDEALSVNIAALPIGDIPAALRRDGHPPFYYFILHFWQDVFGESDLAVRSLSALVGMALLPLAFVAAGRLGGRRAAWAALVIVALNPFVVRYATETRMYEMVMVLGLAAWLVADDALRRATPVRLAGLAALGGLILWSHYWGMWLLGTAGLGVAAIAWAARRRGDTPALGNALKVLGALAVAGLSFLPWLPSLLYQAEHTGTPWGQPQFPTSVLAAAIGDLAGGNQGETVILSWVLVLAWALALFGRPVDTRHVHLDLRTRPETHRLVLLALGTLGIAAVAAYATNATFASRYLSVVAPILLVLAGVGVARLGGAVAFRVVLVVIVGLSLLSGGRLAVSKPRTQARQTADAIVAGRVGRDLVITCPDQLGPALDRVLPDDLEVATYPRFEGPQRVDWVDYRERLDAASPQGFADEVIRRAQGRQVWLVWSGTYITHEESCPDLANLLLRARPWGSLVVGADESFYENSSTFRYPATAPDG